jgi:hypothetical protein
MSKASPGLPSHYPPELLSLLIEAIPRLLRGKKDVLLFFRGAGVGSELTADLVAQIGANPESISKLEIVRTVLGRLNEEGERRLRERREVLKRVVEFRDFATCWNEDQSMVKELVSEIRRMVNVKDSFARMHQAAEGERTRRLAEQATRLAEAQLRKTELSKDRDSLYKLFFENDERKRDESLAGLLNGLFTASGILVREAFALKDLEGGGVEEQFNGELELDNHVYLVELKWLKDRVGRGDVSEHLVRMQSRVGARGIFISASGFTESALTTCKEALDRCVVVLCDLKEIVSLLEHGRELADFLRARISAAIWNKNPYSVGV